MEGYKPVLRGTRKKSLVSRQIKVDSAVASMVEAYIRYLDEEHGEVITESEVYEQAVLATLRRDSGFMKFYGRGAGSRRPRTERPSGDASREDLAERVPVG